MQHASMHLPTGLPPSAQLQTDGAIDAFVHDLVETGQWDWEGGHSRHTLRLEDIPALFWREVSLSLFSADAVTVSAGQPGRLHITYPQNGPWLGGVCVENNAATYHRQRQTLQQ